MMTAQKERSLHLPYQTKAVLFDLDNTLYSREQTFRAWAESFVQTHVVIENEHDAKHVLNRLIELDNYGMTPRETFFQHLREMYSCLCTPVEQLVMEYRQELSSYIVPDENMSHLLHMLKQATIPFGIVTNGSLQSKQRKIERLQLDQWTSCIFISETFGVKKPEASIFLAAASNLNMAPEQILFVGDHPYLDIWGAHAVGMRTAWLQQSLPWPEHLSPTVADLTVRSLNELFMHLCS
jgi:putative hydrolase of the HAD superfamily